MQWSKTMEGLDWTLYISGLNLDIELNLWEYMAPGKFYLKVCIYTRHLKKYLQWQDLHPGH